MIKTLPVIAALLLGLVVCTPAHAKVGAGTKPNIIVVLTDDQHASRETISKMPYLRSRSGWYRFDRAFINNPTCCPSRATFLSGQWSHHTGVEFTTGAARFDDADTIATRLDDAGYRTGWFGKYHLGASAPRAATYVPPGWDDFVDHKAPSPPYFDYTLNENGRLVNYGSAPEDYSTDVLAAKAIRFVKRAAAARAPYFAVFAPRAPHNNWTAAPRHAGTYADEPVKFPKSWNEDTSDKPAWWAQRPEARPANRTGAIRHSWDTLLAVDEALKKLNKVLRKRRQVKDTVVIFTSDNGYAFGEHRWAAKRCVYDSCARVPLYVRYGAHREGKVFKAVVGNEDFAATFAAWAGVSPPAGSDGQSMARMLKKRRMPGRWQDEALLRSANNDDEGSPPDAWALRTRAYLYAETTATGELELYDLATDPHQLQNVAGESLYAPARMRMRERLSVLKARR